MSKAIMIIFLMTSNGAAIEKIEYENSAACEKAAAKIEREETRTTQSYITKIFCTDSAWEPQ